MSGLQRLKDASNKLEEELRRVSTELFSAKSQESFEDAIANKLRVLLLFMSKEKLIRAKPLSLTPQVTEHNKDEETVIREYGELVTSRIVEKQVVKSITQAHAVKALITASDSSLSPELVKRKEQIINHLSEYRDQEYTLQSLDTQLKAKEDEQTVLRESWDREISKLRDMSAGRSHVKALESSGPLHMKLLTVISKIAQMCWLVSKLVMPRTRGYDWLRDPHHRVNALKLARQVYTVETFTHSS